MEKIKEEQREEAVRNVKIRLVLEEICKKENITVEAEEVKEKMKDIPESEYRNALNYYANQLLTDKLLTFLKENN